MNIVVVGGGVGGLAAAIRLQSAGHDVTICERLDRMGGKLDELEDGGFRWETGPSLLTLPDTFRDLAAVAGEDLDDHVTLRRLDPICRYRFPDGSGFDHRADPDHARLAVEGFAPGEGDAWEAFLDRARTVWEISERSFFAGPMANPLRLLQRMRSPRDLVGIDAAATLHDRARRTFTDDRLVAWAGRYATYSGSSPFQAPATLGCIAAIESDLGAWYVDGGLARLADALVTVADRCGVELRTGTDVASITHDGRRVTGVVLAGGERVPADAVVANVDALHLYRDLLPRPRAERRVRRADRSSSGFALLLGLEGITDGLAHHNIAFGADQRGEFDEIFRHRRAPSDPTIYVCASSVTDASVAPAGSENWFVLVNVPAGAGELAGYDDVVLDVLARRGWDVRDRIRVQHRISPADIETRYRTDGGAIYGTSSNGALAAFLRPSNRGAVEGLYLCGGASHPGGGLPLVAMSGRIAADELLRDADRP